MTVSRFVLVIVLMLVASSAGGVLVGLSLSVFTAPAETGEVLQ